MEIKIATKTLNELKSSLSSAADQYREVRIVFSKKSLLLYINIIKIIEREYEAIRALKISFIELIQELLNIKSEHEMSFCDNSKSMILSIIDDINNMSNNINNPEEVNKLNTVLLNTQQKFKSLYDHKLENTNKLIGVIHSFITLGNGMIKFINDLNYHKQQNTSIDPDSSDFMNTLNDYNRTMKDYFTIYVGRITELNNDTNINLSKINELQKNLKDKYNIINKKIDGTINIISKDVKLIIKEKKEEVKNQMISKLSDYLKTESNAIIDLLNKFEFVFNETYSIIFTNINIYTSVINLKESEMFSESLELVKSLTKNIHDNNLLNKKEDFKHLVYNYDNIEEKFEKYKEIINTEILDFLSYRKDLKINLIHERKCVMYNEQLDTSFDKNLSIKPNYFGKVKDLIVRKFKNLKTKANLFENIDLIMSECSNLKEKEFENYITNHSVYHRKEEAHWFDKLFTTWYNRWKDSELFLKWFKKLLYRIYNKKRPDNLDTIYIDDVKLSGSPPHLKCFKELEFDRKSEYEV